MKEGDILLDGLGLTALSSSRRRDLCGTTLDIFLKIPMTAFDKEDKDWKANHRNFSDAFKIIKGGSISFSPRKASKW